jgi:RNA polymerase sigma-70 factor, ECF subfamily
LTTADEVNRALADAHRHEWAQVLAATVRVAGDLDLAQECAQDAYLSALETWRRDGIPRNPGAWLTIAARRKALDSHRRAAALRAKIPLLITEAGGISRLRGNDGGSPSPESQLTEMDQIPDDRLRLVFICCHPALAREAQVALTLRLVCGLTTEQIAHAFLVSEPTMAARVTRAKKKISGARIPYRVPDAAELPERLDAVLTAVHLVFTAGHTAPTGDLLVRPDLVDRAIELCRVLADLMPDEREVRGLLALMLVTDARRATRVDEAGRLVLLEDQDRSRWDHVAIEQCRVMVLEALRGGRPGRFVIQAAIAALHAEAPHFADTDWEQVVDLYDLLLEAWPSPVVALNRIVAVGFRSGPEAGLAALDQLEAEAGRALSTYHYLPAARADFLRRLGREEAAAASYRRALVLVENDVERAFLERRLATLLTPGVDVLG